jgi:hypothetical protein
MNDTEKSQMYTILLSQHDKLGNQISEIKGESFDLNEEQEKKIHHLKSKQYEIMQRMQQLMSRV